MYDKVSKMFFGNIGTGNFIAGNITPNGEKIDNKEEINSNIFNNKIVDVARKIKKQYIGIDEVEKRELPEGYT
jgi:hypothetical protein